MSIRSSRSPRSTSSSPPGGCRSSSAGPVSTCARRSRGSSFHRRCPPRCAPGSSDCTTGSAPSEPTPRWSSATPAAAARVHPNDRRRVVPGTRARRARGVARARLGHALGRRVPASDGRGRARRSARRARLADRGPNTFDGRTGVVEEARRRSRARSPRLRSRSTGCGTSLSCRSMRPSRRTTGASDAMPRISGSGCAASPASSSSTRTDLRPRWPMRSSRWHAHGNVYLVTEPCGLTAERVREHVGDADGILEVARRRPGRDLEPRRLAGGCRATAPASPLAGSRSGRARAFVTCTSARASVVARMLDGDDVEQELGAVRVGAPEVVEGVELDRGRRRQPARGRPRRSGELRLGPAPRDTRALPEPHERPGGARGRARRGDRARVGARGGRDARVRDERGRRRGGDAPCRRRGGRSLPGRRSARPPRARPRLPDVARQPGWTNRHKIGTKTRGQRRYPELPGVGGG